MSGVTTLLASQVNRALGLVGLRLQRVGAPTRSFSFFFGQLNRLGFSPKTVIDVGIAHGTPAIYEALPEARYFLIEPVAECKPVLERLKKRLNAEYFLVAVGAENGEVAFNVHDDISGSSLYKQAEGAVLDGVPRTVPMVRLDSLLPAQMDRPVLLKIDTQGAEIEVLRGLGTRIAEIDIIIAETSLMPFRHGVPEIADVIRYCADQGFSVYDVLEGHTRPLDGGLAQVDVAFVRTSGQLRSDPRVLGDQQLAAHMARSQRS